MQFCLKLLVQTRFWMRQIWNGMITAATSGGAGVCVSEHSAPNPAAEIYLASGIGVYYINLVAQEGFNVLISRLLPF